MRKERKHMVSDSTVRIAAAEPHSNLHQAQLFRSTNQSRREQMRDRDRKKPSEVQGAMQEKTASIYRERRDKMAARCV